MNPILLTVWGILTACFLGLLMYRGQLTRYEEEQLFLNDEIHLQEQDHQEAIVRRVKKITPVVKFFGAAAGLATVCAVGMYVWDAWVKLQS